MANPNIVNVTSILGNTTSVVATTGNVQLLSNPASSGQVYKINSVIATNTGNSTTEVTIRLFSEDDLGGSGNSIISSISVPIKSALVVIDRSIGVYVTEDRSIGVSASANNQISVMASWEEIS